eukprot:scaffold458430_cov42-Prasinocladus_malaysianus.AAC.1
MNELDSIPNSLFVATTYQSTYLIHVLQINHANLAAVGNFLHVPAPCVMGLIPLCGQYSLAWRFLHYFASSIDEYLANFSCGRCSEKNELLHASSLVPKLFRMNHLIEIFATSGTGATNKSHRATLNG